MAKKIKFKRFIYVPSDAGKSYTKYYTKQEVLDEFLDFWMRTMKDAQGNENLFDDYEQEVIERACISSWARVYDVMLSEVHEDV